MTTNTNPPPIGIMPRWIWLGKRRDDLYDAICRYRLAGYTPLTEWVREILLIEQELRNENYD